MPPPACLAALQKKQKEAERSRKKQKKAERSRKKQKVISFPGHFYMLVS
jgi:hypothetical protein